MRTSSLCALILQIFIKLALALAFPHHESTLLHVLHNSPFTGPAGAELEQLLEILEEIASAPCWTSLVNAPELQFGVRRFCKEQLSKYPSLDESNLEHWLQDSNSFLAAHSQGTHAVVLPSNITIMVPTAQLSGLPMTRRSLLARLLQGWLRDLHRQLPARLEPQLANFITQVGFSTPIISRKRRIILEILCARTTTS